MKKRNSNTELASQDWYPHFTRFVQLKGLRRRSKKTYLGWIQQLARHYPDTDPPELSKDQVLDFLIHSELGRIWEFGTCGKYRI